jgi:hypothetical protein
MFWIKGTFSDFIKLKNTQKQVLKFLKEIAQFLRTTKLDKKYKPSKELMN